jgi:CubicO group peptidase (beta-lactamase class C family)
MPCKVTFDDHAFDFIPWAHPLSDPRKARITVKQLLNHTSGICPEPTGAPNDGNWDARPAAAVSGCLKNTCGRPARQSSIYPDRASTLLGLRTGVNPTFRPPGAKWIYHQTK